MLKPSVLTRIMVPLIAVVCAVTATSCSATEPKPRPSHTSAAPKLYTQPLTGIEVTQLPQNPAVAVKIPADPHAQPQIGLAEADNVWVELVEGGAIRYNAVYYSTLPDTVGPIRSIRPVDAAINAPIRPVVLTSGGQPDFLTQLQQNVGLVLTEDSAGDAAWRIREKRAPYNLYGSPAAAAAKATELTKPKAQWEFGTPPQGKAVTDFTVSYPNWTSKWIWNGQMWLRQDNQREAIDAAGKQLGATTVIVLQVNTHPTAYRDPAGAPVIDTELVGSGEAKIAVNGEIIEAKWHKDSVTTPVKLTTTAGKPVKLAPGKIWIELAPASPTWFNATAAQTPTPTGDTK